jgi:hypothetical protein
MRRIVCMFVLVAGPLIVWPLSSASSAPDPTTCTGYPEPRVYMEDQSWWEPQVGPPSHPGTGKMGHIHVETCFPLYQRFGGTGTIGFDITVRLHNMPGEMKDLRIDSYGDFKLDAISNVNWRCPTADCAQTFHVDLPLDKMQYSGLHALQIEAYVKNEDGRIQFTLPRWPVYLDNGKPLPPPGSVTQSIASDLDARGVIGDTWYQNDGPGGNYSQVAITREDYPWDPLSGQTKVKSGVWEPRVFFESDTGFAYLDAALHANPPTKTVVYEGPGHAWGPWGVSKLRIDTTSLTDGPHKLLIGTCNTRGIPTGNHCGTQVIRFMVRNHPDPAPPALADTTKPILSALSLSPKRFRAARSGRVIASSVGTTISYTLSEAAAVKFRIERRRVRGRCAKPSRPHRRAKGCTRYTTLRGSFTHQGQAGANKLRFTGRLKGRKQQPGRYRLRATATDPAGNKSPPKRSRFRIIRRSEALPHPAAATFSFVGANVPLVMFCMAQLRG